MNAAVLDMIKKSAAVPSMPQLVLRFLEVMQDPHFDYSDLAKVMSADPGTVSEMLRLCNSALFGIRQKVASLRQALILLGPTRTRSLLLGRYLVDTVSQKPAPGLDRSYFWRRSLAGAVVSARLADTVLPKERDEVFIAALLADIGIPILAEAFPDRYSPLAARFAPRGNPVSPEEERDAVEVTHGEVSAMVLAHWTLPDVVCQAVNLHQSPIADDGVQATFARLIHAGECVSRILCEVPDPTQILFTCTEVETFAGIGLETLSGLLTTVENDIEELARVLRISVIPSKAYSLIVKTIKEHLAVGAAS